MFNKIKEFFKKKQTVKSDKDLKENISVNLRDIVSHRNRVFFQTDKISFIRQFASLGRSKHHLWKDGLI
jgi:hypothetical protein